MRRSSTTVKIAYFAASLTWVGLIALRVFFFDLMAYYVFSVIHSEVLVFADEVVPIAVAIAVRKISDLLLKRVDYEVTPPELQCVCVCVCVRALLHLI